MSGEAAERAYIGAILDARAGHLADITASTQAELDRLRESWAGGADLAAGHQDRMAQMRAETRRQLRAMYDDEATEPAPSQNVAARGADASLPSPSTGSSDGHNPGQQPNPRDVELAEAQRIRQLPMASWAEERTRLIQPSASTRGMF
jgi:uncharacterized protein YukE